MLQVYRCIGAQGAQSAMPALNTDRLYIKTNLHRLSLGAKTRNYSVTITGFLPAKNMYLMLSVVIYDRCLKKKMLFSLQIFFVLEIEEYHKVHFSFLHLFFVLTDDKPVMPASGQQRLNIQVPLVFHLMVFKRLVVTVHVIYYSINYCFC